MTEFISSSDALLLEQKHLKHLKKLKNQFQITDFVKVLLLLKKILKKNFGFLNEFFINVKLKEFVQEYFESEKIEITKIFLAESSNNGEKVDVLPYKYILIKPDI